MAKYQIILLGSPADAHLDELRQAVSTALAPFGLRLDQDVAWSIQPADLKRSDDIPSVAAFFGGSSSVNAPVAKLLKLDIPILPIVSDQRRVADEIPEKLRNLNCLEYAAAGPQRIATALLECLELLPRRRRLFLSYRRSEARAAAAQLFEALWARQFEVFLDTHSVGPAVDFQAELWHQLCDSDVLVMLSTPGYFESRWTDTEFGRADTVGLPIVQVIWPETKPSKRTLHLNGVNAISLAHGDVDTATGELSADSIKQIAFLTETARCQGHAVRMQNLLSRVRIGVESIHGKMDIHGPNGPADISLPQGPTIKAFPAIGAPSAVTMHNAVMSAGDEASAVLYNPVGLRPDWVAHLRWLGDNSKCKTRFVRAPEAGWDLAGWDLPE